MGLFSGKKKTYVSSVVYPLGEDDGEKKVDFLQYTVLNSTLQGQPLGESIAQGYLRGQGMSLRNSFIYARDKFTNGVPISAAKYYAAPDRTELDLLLQAKHPGSRLEYLALVVGTADHEWFAEQYLSEQFGYDRTARTFERPPAGVDRDAAIAYDLEPNGLIRILLMNADGASKVVDFRPTAYKAMADFVHCCYQAVQTFDSGISTTTRPAAPGEIDSVSTTVQIVERAGEIQTTTIRVTVDVEGSTATVQSRKTVEVRTRPQYFLYRLGTGTYPVLDTWVQDTKLTSPYYPAVPLRVNNVDVTDEAHQDTPLYKTSKKLLDRVGVKLDKLAENLNDNESIKDIDFAFVVFAIALNTKAQDGKRYLYRYFEYLRGITSATTTKASHDAWTAAYASGQTATPPEINMVEIYSAKDRANNYDIKLQWDYIDTRLVQGVVFEGAKPGDVDLSMSGTRTQFAFGSMDLVMDSSKLYARRQVDADTYEEMEISGLYYENFIYKGKAISISAYDAFHDPDEQGFLVPLNQQVLRAMPLREVTDLSYYCCHMVLNCYQVVKQKWYQTGLFKIILVIIAIIIIIVTWGAGTPVAATMMATAFTAIGIAATLAIVLAATLYVLGVMIIMSILAKTATKVFGEKWGPIIAMVIGLFAGQLAGSANMASSAASTGITAAQVMQASTAVLNAYSHYAAYQVGQTMQDITKLQEQYEQKFDELEKLTEEMLGTNTDLLDIQGLTESTYQRFFEPMDQFLSRTLLVGGDICDITNGQITNFVDLGLQLPVNG